MKPYQKPDTTLWRGRSSTSHRYLHEKLECLELDALPDHTSEHPAFVFLGYACDEGVRRNSGRTGAVLGPAAIRKTMGGLANHWSEETKIYDAGDIRCLDGDLEGAQAAMAEAIKWVVDKNIFPIVLGGGHDLAYAHARGLLRAKSKERWGIINLDAHFDLRIPKNQGHSGSPFYQLSQEQGASFRYTCLGIQPEVNTTELFQTAERTGTSFLLADDFHLDNQERIVRHLDAFIKDLDAIYLTIDLDGFHSVLAPGVSAPSPMGFDLSTALFVLDYLVASGKLRSMDLVELNPTYDRDECTARLAGRLAYRLMYLMR
ncbi:formimidoylglutamase [Croceiramulus getboli]|nr:formimidoylglutamase [Flavobacteriaceae bacterium YJPT1-3]